MAKQKTNTCIQNISNGVALSTLAREIIWIPRHNKDGAITTYSARPLPNIEGASRFFDPKGSNGEPLIGPRAYAAQDKSNVPIIIGEGASRLYLVEEAGFAAISLNGVWGAHIGKAQPPLSLRAELAVFQWTGRRVLLAPDADWQSNPQVRRALLRLAFLFHAAGAVVYHLSWSLAEGKGLDEDELLVVGLWVFGIPLMQLFSTYPLLRLVSPVPGCGKSRLLDAIKLFA
jgi:Domain of unknown function (DUF3854)